MTTLRLEWPQWQGGEPAAVERLTPGLDHNESRIAYGLGGQIAAYLAAPHVGPVARVHVPDYIEDLPVVDSIVGKAEVLRQHDEALQLIRTAGVDRIVTIGGTCAVSLTPFAHLASLHPDDLAVVWLDSHADCNLPGGPNWGFNTMVVSHLCGYGDQEVLDHLPATLPPHRVLLAGVNAWDDQDSSTHESWGMDLVRPAPTEPFRDSVLNWLRASGVRHVAVHFDLDVINSDEHAFGMAWEKGGISKATALEVIRSISEEFDLVGLTVSEYVSREAAALSSILHALPLLGPDRSGSLDSPESAG